MVGPVNAHQGKVVRPSQLIRSVGQTMGVGGALHGRLVLAGILMMPTASMASVPDQGAPVAIEVQIQSTTIGCSIEGTAAAVVFHSTVMLTNLRPSPIIVLRKLDVSGTYKLADSQAEAKAGNFRLGVQSDLRLLRQGEGIEWESLGPTPDPQLFAVVAGGERLELPVAFSVMGAVPADVHANLMPRFGQSYVLKTSLSAWPMGLSEQQVEQLARRWVRHGELVVATLETPLIGVTLPAATTFTACE